MEDPVADPALLALVRAELPGVPVLLDEGIRTLEQIEAAARHADGANVKLVKFGGLFTARRALDRLGELGVRRMLGCFVEPPRAIAYAALLAGQAEWADLDGHLILEGVPGILEGVPGGSTALGSGPAGWSAGMLVLDSGVPGIPRVVNRAVNAQPGPAHNFLAGNSSVDNSQVDDHRGMSHQVE